MRVITPAPGLRDFQRIAAYNPCMHHATQSPLSRLLVAGLDRITLAANHVLAAEPQAVARLKSHAGRVVDGGGLLPVLWPAGVSSLAGVDMTSWAARWRITPAGLLDRLPVEGDPLGAPAPAADVVVAAATRSMTALLRAMAAHDFTPIEVHGDAAMVADVRWVIENVRWDYAGDLQRVLPSPVGMPVARAAEALVAGARRGVQALDAIWPRSAPVPEAAAPSPATPSPSPQPPTA